MSQEGGEAFNTVERRRYQGGKRVRFLNVVNSKALLRQAIAELRGKFHAPATTRGQEAAVKLYLAACEGCEKYPWPVTADALQAMVAAMVAADYHCVVGYVNHVMAVSVLRGYEVSDSVKAMFKHLKRAAQRNAGRAKQVTGLTPSMLRRAIDSSRTSEESVVAHMGVLPITYLLRIDEVAKRKRKDVPLHDDGCLRLHIPFSKMDSAGRGLVGTVKCMCGDARICAPCSAKSLLDICPSRCRQGERSLATDASGKAVTYARYVKVLRKLMGRVGERTVDREGRQRFGGHSGRRGGAQSLAGAGFSLAYIKTWGRWGSDCVRRYCEEASAEAIGGCIGLAMTEGQTALAKAWKTAEGKYIDRI